MPVESLGVTELQRRAPEIVRHVSETGIPTLITRHGRPAAVLVAVDDDALEDFVFAHVPAFARSLGDADQALEAGATLAGADVYGPDD